MQDPPIPKELHDKSNTFNISFSKKEVNSILPPTAEN